MLGQERDAKFSNSIDRDSKSTIGVLVLETKSNETEIEMFDLSSKCGQDFQSKSTFIKALKLERNLESKMIGMNVLFLRMPNAWGLELDQTGSKSATETWTWMPDLLRLEIESTGLNS